MLVKKAININKTFYVSTSKITKIDSIESKFEI